MKESRSSLLVSMHLPPKEAAHDVPPMAITSLIVKRAIYFINGIRSCPSLNHVLINEADTEVNNANNKFYFTTVRGSSVL